MVGYAGAEAGAKVVGGHGLWGRGGEEAGPRVGPICPGGPRTNIRWRERVAEGPKSTVACSTLPFHPPSLPAATARTSGAAPVDPPRTAAGVTGPSSPPRPGEPGSSMPARPSKYASDSASSVAYGSTCVGGGGPGGAGHMAPGCWLAARLGTGRRGGCRCGRRPGGSRVRRPAARRCFDSARTRRDAWHTRAPERRPRHRAPPWRPGCKSRSRARRRC